MCTRIAGSFLHRKIMWTYFCIIECRSSHTNAREHVFCVLKFTRKFKTKRKMNNKILSHILAIDVTSNDISPLPFSTVSINDTDSLQQLGQPLQKNNSIGFLFVAQRNPPSEQAGVWNFFRSNQWLDSSHPFDAVTCVQGVQIQHELTLCTGYPYHNINGRQTTKQCVFYAVRFRYCCSPYTTYALHSLLTNANCALPCSII